MQRQWFVFYTKSRQEKKVEALLRKRGFETFLPLTQVMRQWTDRKKKVEVPLFNSYIFVREFEHKITNILQTPGIAWNIRHNDRPAILRDAEVEIIQRFLDTGYTVQSDVLSKGELEAGEHAMIIDGPLKGIEGVVLSKSEGPSFHVALLGIDQLIRVQIPAFLLKKL